ncbi:unnamed protein product [Mytilus coruscus]|uniref:Uncharacterized protein n=1 Tax=Mytilus coruscus TaxID=42192 RepID=A0A6J8DR56_MYTCO|nr:unnamed protein product [Mytilus coruscus]
MYSDECVPGTHILDSQEIEKLFKAEVMKITRKKTYIGMWQDFALSSVLCRRVYSVYPLQGNTNVRNDLHRLDEPRERKSAHVAYIMWTTTRTDMLQLNWDPNLFVSVLPVDNPNTTNIPTELQRWRLMWLRKIEDRREKEDKSDSEVNHQEYSSDNKSSHQIEHGTDESASRKEHEKEVEHPATTEKIRQTPEESIFLESQDNMPDRKTILTIKHMVLWDIKISNTSKVKRVQKWDVEKENEFLECIDKDKISDLVAELESV